MRQGGRWADILGVRVDDVTLAEAVALLLDWTAERRPRLVVTPNPEMVMAARQDAEFRAILNGAALAVPDGIGLVWAARLLGEPLRTTAPGVDLVAALVIHGWADYHVPPSDGETARDFWRMRNGCSDVTVPPIADVHAAVMTTPETHGCAEYQGCDPGLPVVWCEHSEGGYDGSTHGWPLFGGQQIWDFVSTL